MNANDLTLRTAREHEAKLQSLAAPTRVDRPRRSKRPRERALARTIRLAWRFIFVVAVVAASATAVPTTAGASTAPAPVFEPETLTRARTIRAELTARYGVYAGRRLVVTEATTTGVVPTLTLLTDWLEPRVVPAVNGIYYATCSARARCPYPARSAWPPLAFLPRRLAVELALCTFEETSVALVVVALPTAEPVWVVFERNDLAGKEAVDGLLLPDVVDRLTRARLFRPLPILPPPTDTIYAEPLFAP
jgi:hypothetical protein